MDIYGIYNLLHLRIFFFFLTLSVILQFEDLGGKKLLVFKRWAHLLVINITLFNKAVLINVKFIFSNVWRLRDAFKEKNAALIWVFSKPGLNRPLGIVELLGHFLLVNFFPKILGHFLPNIPKLLGHKKGPQNFWIGPELPFLPPPYRKKPKLKLHFFCEASLSVSVCKKG